MKKTQLLLVFLLSAVSAFAGIDPSRIVTIQGYITSNRTFHSDSAYLLKGFVYVKNNATVKIEAGTLIMGDKATKGALIITRNGKIEARGTAQKPIVFTSNQAPGSRNIGDWAGLVLFGQAPVNAPNLVYEGGVLNSPDPQDNILGGNDPHHSSGVLSYVRIEFAGLPIQPDREVNGLTLGGIGDGTQIDHIQVSYSGDDSYEWFGGTVNCKNLIAYCGVDDDWDTDNGYAGNVQFGFSLRSKTISDANSGSNGFESDNDGNGSNNQPFTQAVFTNMTVAGPLETLTTNITGQKFLRGAHIRRNSAERVFNTVWLGWPTGIRIDGAGTYNQIMSNFMELKNNIIAGCPKTIDTAGGIPTTFDANSWLNGGNNTVLTNNTDVMLNAPYNYTNPDPTPKAGSPVLTGADWTNSKLSSSFFTHVNYKGAFDQNSNWMAGWSNFDPQNTDYVLTPSGINDAEKTKLDVSVYPNPANEKVTISFFETASGNKTVTILDMGGKIISESTASYGYGLHNIELETSGLHNGCYFVRISGTDGTYTNQLIIAR